MNTAKDLAMVSGYFLTLLDGKHSHPALDVAGGHGGKDSPWVCAAGSDPGLTENSGFDTNMFGDETPFHAWDLAMSHPVLDGYLGTGGPDTPKVIPDSMGKRNAENTKVLTNLLGDDPGTMPVGNKESGPPSLNCNDVCGHDYPHLPEPLATITPTEGTALDADENLTEDVMACTAGRDGPNEKAPVKKDGKHRAESECDTCHATTVSVCGHPN